MCHTSEGVNFLLGGAHGAVEENGDGDGAWKKLDFRFVRPAAAPREQGIFENARAFKKLLRESK